MSDEVDRVEMRNALVGLAEMTRVFYSELVDQGFKEGEALKLSGAWLRSITEGGSSSS